MLFFIRKKVRKYIFESKSCYPQKLFTTVFQNILPVFYVTWYVNKIIDFGLQYFIFLSSSNFKYMVSILFAQTQDISFEPSDRFTPPYVISEKVEFLVKLQAELWIVLWCQKKKFWSPKSIILFIYTENILKIF